MDTAQADMGNQQGNRQGDNGTDRVTGEATGWQGWRQGDSGGLAKWGKMNKSPLLTLRKTNFMLILHGISNSIYTHKKKSQRISQTLNYTHTKKGKIKTMNEPSCQRWQSSKRGDKTLISSKLFT